MEAMFKVLFVIILIGSDLVSFSIIVNITRWWVDWRAMILRCWRFKSMSQHCLIHLIFYDVSTLLPILFVLRRDNLFEAFGNLVSLFRCIILLVILLYHQRWLLSDRCTILGYSF